MAPKDFQFEVENSTDELENKVTTTECEGKLVRKTAPELRDLVKPLILQGCGTVLASAI